MNRMTLPTGSAPGGRVNNDLRCDCATDQIVSQLTIPETISPFIGALSFLSGASHPQTLNLRYIGSHNRPGN
jgi:hypothetical protein